MDDLTISVIAHELLLIRVLGTLALKTDDPPRYLTAVRDNIRKDISQPTTIPVSDTDNRRIMDRVDHLLSNVRISPERGD